MVPVFRTTEIKPTRTVGDRLKSARLERQLSLEQAERLTKIKLKYLKALEQDRHEALPTEVYCLGFIRCYAEVLHLKSAKLISQYKQERRAFQSAKNPDRQLKPATSYGLRKLVITPALMGVAGGVILIVSFASYLALSIRALLSPPKLSVSSPTPDSTIQGLTVTVKGQSDNNATVAINGELVKLDGLGQFEQPVKLAPGLNNLEVVAESRLDQITRQNFKLLAVEPTPTPTPTPSAPVPVPNISPTPNPT